LSQAPAVTGEFDFRVRRNLHMKHMRLSALAISLPSALALCGVALAQGNLPSFTQIATIPVPGGLAGFDIAWIDPGSERFYLADRTATKGTGRIDVVDTQTNTFLYTIPATASEIGFAGTTAAVTKGCSISGPNGVVAIPQLHQLYVGDGDSTVKVVDLDAKAVVAVIPTGGQCRADELAYDPVDHIIMIANDNDSPPFLTFISTDKQTVLGRYTYASTQSGLEQAVWNAKAKRFFIAVPAPTNGLGSVDVFNPTTMLKENSFSTSICSPAGLVLTATQHLMTSCGVVLDAGTGGTMATLSNVSGDEIWYNPGDNFYYFGATQAAVVDATTNAFLGYLPSAAGHSLAVDPNNNHIFAPVTGVGIKVFAQQ
jgi:hypothetical protein